MPKALKTDPAILLTPEEVWREEACTAFGTTIRLSSHAPRSLLMGEMMADRVFGDLCHHDFQPARQGLTVVCQGCRFARGRDDGACAAHAGILWGLVEGTFKTEFALARMEHRAGVCVLALRRCAR